MGINLIYEGAEEVGNYKDNFRLRDLSVEIWHCRDVWTGSRYEEQWLGHQAGS